LRAVVAVTSRNVIIRGSNEDNWGGRVLVYWWFSEDIVKGSVDQKGLVLFDGVEFDNMGQRDVDQAGLDFRSVSKIPTDNLDRSLLINSVMHDCIGLCFQSVDSKGWDVKNSVFLKAHAIHMQIKNSTDYVINTNAFIGALDRNLSSQSQVYDTKAFIYVLTSFNP